MIQKVKDLQNNAVSNLYNYVLKQRYTTFKAPTGSGKTYMMADLMNRFLFDANIVFIVSSLSKAELGKQNYEKFVEYNNIFNNLNPFLINSNFAEEEKIFIPSTYNVYVLPRDLYKNNSKIKNSNAFISLLMTLKFNKKQIFLIKDECHIATSNLDELNDYFDKIINFSATPKLVPDIEITNEEAINAQLIKHLAEQSNDNNNLYSININNTIEEVIDKFIEIKNLYVTKLKINPCLIIQISNKNKAKEEWCNIKKIISDKNKNLKWMYIVDNNTKECDTNDDIKKLPILMWKNYAKSNSSLIDIIVFKMVITEGWDIPRACMLYQVRDSKSKMMDEQVVGRVRRNPILTTWENYDEEAHKLALTSWVWGLSNNNSNNYKQIFLKDNCNISIKTTKLKSIEKCETFNINNFINNKSFNINTMSIFDLYKKWDSISKETANLCWNNIRTSKDWVKYSNFIDEIDSANTNFMANYNDSMEIDSIVNLPNISYFKNTNITTDVSNWIWHLNNINDDEYCFDSEAEKEFAKILKRLGTNQWGKNYYLNSLIKFEYVLYGKHESYPDFILKDKDNFIHIFEIKSINQSYILNIDYDNYIEKLNAIKNMFKYASKLTNQYFYVAIKINYDWKIHQFFNGEEHILTKNSFIEFITKLI